jgi:hypothetical protein
VKPQDSPERGPIKIQDCSPYLRKAGCRHDSDSRLCGVPATYKKTRRPFLFGKVQEQTTTMALCGKLTSKYQLACISTGGKGFGGPNQTNVIASRSAKRNLVTSQSHAPPSCTNRGPVHCVRRNEFVSQPPSGTKQFW